MRGVPLVLGAGLGLSALLNLVLVVRIGRSDVNAGAPRAREDAAAPSTARSEIRPSPRGDEASALIQEIRQLRREVAALREGSEPAPAATTTRSPSGPGPEPSIPADLPAWIANDPILVQALAERQAIRQAAQKYWRDLDRAHDLRSVIGVAKYREIMAGLTADYLGLDSNTSTAFVSAAVQANRELDRAETERADELTRARIEIADRDTRKRMEAELEARYELQKKGAVARLDPFLDTSLRHQEIRTRLTGRWFEYFRAK